jgi:hypothetical protein
MNDLRKCDDEDHLALLALPGRIYDQRFHNRYSTMRYAIPMESCVV